MGILSALVEIAFVDRKSPYWWVGVSSVILGVSTLTAIIAILVAIRINPAGSGSMISQNLCVVALAGIAFWTRSMLIDLVRNRPSPPATRTS